MSAGSEATPSAAAAPSPVPPVQRRRIPHPWSALSGLPRDVWILCAATLVNRAGSMAILFLVLYLTGRGWSTRHAGWVVSVFGIGAVVAAPIAGRLCDRIGAHRVVLGSLFLPGFVLVLFPFVDGAVAIVLATLLWSVTGESFRPASYTLVSHAAPPERRRAAFAALRVAINIGASIGPAVGGLLARVSMPALFIVDGATSIAAGCVLWMARRRRTREAATAPRPEAPGATDPHTSRFGLLADPRFVRLVVAMLLLTTAFFQIISTLALDLVRGQGMSEVTLGFLFALNAVLVVLCEIWISARIAHWPAPRSMALGALLIASGVGATAWAHDGWSAAATVVVWTLGEMVLFPASSTYVTEIAAPARRGEAMGLYTAAFGVGFILAPALGTWALGRWGADAAWGGAFVLGCIAAAMLLRLDARPREVVPSSV